MIVFLVFSLWQMVFCSLTEFQKAVYQAVLETDDVTLVLRAGEPCSCNSGRKRKNCCYKVRTSHCLGFSRLNFLGDSVDEDLIGMCA